MARLLLLFGRTPELSIAEVSALVPHAERLSVHCAAIPDEPVIIDGQQLSAASLLSILGGTVKIAREETVMADVRAGTIAQILAAGTAGGKLTFGVSAYDTPPDFYNPVTDVKSLLTHSGISSRYMADPDGVLPSATVGKSGMTEIVIVKSEGGFIIGKTVAVQRIDEWSKRDYGRPHRDTKVGMLPPKIARIAVNIALGPDGRGKTLLDPFCGMGTVLTEGLVRGASVIGTDIEKSVAARANENVHWASGVFGYHAPIRVETADATHIDELVPAGSVDAMVTEPYMGPIGLGLGKVTDPEKLANIMKGLQKLYIGALRSVFRVLKPGATAVFAVPRFTVGKRRYDVKKAVDMCENLGYTKVLGPVEYSREGAVVSREFYIVRKGEVTQVS